MIAFTITGNPIWLSLTALMAFIMASHTKGNDIQPIFLGITFVVIVFGLLSAIGTGLGSDTGEFTTFNGVVDSFLGLFLMRVFLGIFNAPFLSRRLSLFRLIVFFARYPPLFRSVISPAILSPCFSLSVLFQTHLAPTLKTVFFIAAFTEFCERLLCITLSTYLLNNHFGASFKQKIKSPLGQLRKRQPAQLGSQWGSINYNTYAIIKQFVPANSTGWHRYYTTMYEFRQ